MQRKTIVILGGGFAGLRAALELERLHDDRYPVEIILIDQAPHHLYTPLLYEVASAFLYNVPIKERFCARTGVCVEFASSSVGRFLKHTRLIHGEILDIHPQERHVVVRDHAPLVYDACLIALGSVVDDFGIAGIHQHAESFKTLDDALRIHERIYELVRGRRRGTKERVSVVIGGGGPTGVELAGELAGFCAHTCSSFGLQKEDFSVTLVEASNRLMRGLHPTISRWARERLERLGVEVSLDMCVQRVTKENVTIVPRPLREGETQSALLCDFGVAKEKVIESDLFIWSGGVRASELLARTGLMCDRKGRIEVEETLRAKGEEHVFVAGDAAALLDPRTNQTVPALAQTAIFQGKLAAQNIIRSFRGKPLRRYRFPFLAHIIPLGGKYAYAEFGPFRARGFFMYLLRRFVDLKYFLSILPTGAALGTWWHGWRVYAKND